MRRGMLIVAIAAATALATVPAPAVAVVPGDDGVIAFERQTAGGTRIAMIEPDGAGMVELPEAEGVDDSSPAWSPDGTRLAYVRRVGEEIGDSTDIWVMDADGTDRRAVTRNGRYDHRPAWSPDGTALVFERIAPNGAHRLWVKVLGGPPPARITRISSFYPDWSPDGSTILFMRRGGNLYTVAPDGSGLAQLTHTPRFWEHTPAWSPDGGKILFSGWWPRQNADVFVMRADGTDVVNLTSTAGAYEALPAWSPSGTRIVYLFHEDPDPAGLWVSAADGSDRHFVFGPWPWGPDWQPLPGPG